MAVYTESETGAAMCGNCDLWIDGIGANACVCCRDCVGSEYLGQYFDKGRWHVCESCNGTGRAKAVA